MSPDPALVTGRLNVNDYVESRASDIRALQQMIEQAGSSSKKRAFQSLPRVERRRVASHNPKRVPRKRGLRKRAEIESIRDKAKKSTKRRRSAPVTDVAKSVRSIDVTSLNRKVAKEDLLCLNTKYGQRQKDKTWLPTHIWHRKRASMTVVAGIVVPEKATQKQFRKTYRLQNHLDKSGAMAWDTSYISTFVARHTQLADLLGAVFPDSTQGIYHDRVKIWSKVSPGMGPALVYWLDPSSAVIQCHPLLFDELWDKLLGSVPGVELEDCRFALGSIDVAGPSARRVLNNVCALASHQRGEPTPCKLIESEFSPIGAVVNASVVDPRIGKHIELSADSKAQLPMLVFTKSHRQASLDSQESQSTIDKARSSETNLSCASVIPICVMTLDQSRLRLILPRAWVLPFWLQIFKKRNVLLGGQLEYRQLFFESKIPFFPNDFAHTRSGSAYNIELGLQRKTAYDRRPKTQKQELSSEIGDPFLPADLETLKTSKQQGSLMHAEVQAIRRGVPKAGARIFNLPDDHQDEQKQTGRCTDSSLFCPDNLLGFVTTGMFSFTESKGFGIALVQNISRKRCVVRNIGSKEGFYATLASLKCSGGVA